MSQLSRVVLSNLIFCLLVSSVHAGQAYIINKDGDPVLWDASASDSILIHPESGECGQFTNAQMATRLTNNLEAWTDINTVDLAFTITTGTVTGVDGCNYTDYLSNVGATTSTESSANVQDGINPVLFDNDGEIIDAAAGSSARYSVLGFANPAGFLVDTNDASLYTEIVDGQAVFNCYCLEDASGNPAHSDCTTNSVVFETEDLDFTMIHEIGHFMNLDHTAINTGFQSDSDSSNDADLPTMYPESVTAATQMVPHEDDVIALSHLYPSSSFFTAGNTGSTYCKVTGTLLDSDGDEMRCASVQAIDAADDSNNISFMSGAYAPAVDNNADNDSADSGECTSNCGDFQLFLKPGETYTIKTVVVPTRFRGGSGISPCANATLADCDASTSNGCVKNETLTTNDNSENISTKILNECTAGATVALGNVSGNSISPYGSTPSISSFLINNINEQLKDYEALEARFLPYADSGSPFYAATSCPESGGGSGSNATSSSGSSSSGCSLPGTSQSGSILSCLWFLLAGLILIVVRGVQRES